MSASTPIAASYDDLDDIMSLPSDVEEEDGDDDDVSTTSTVIDYYRTEGQNESDNPETMFDDPDDPEKLWEVEAVVAERRNREGKMRYLVHWVKFPLYRSTWEFAENFPDDGLDSWEEKKAEIAAGLKEPFNREILRWQRAVMVQNEKRLKRNAKRKRLGLPFKRLNDYEQPFKTDWDMNLDELDEGDSVTDMTFGPEEEASEVIVCHSSSDEADEVDMVDDVESGPPYHPRQPQQRGNRIFKGIIESSSTPTSSRKMAGRANPSPGIHPRTPANHSGKSHTASKSITNPSITSPRLQSTMLNPQIVTAKPSATGYQGTAWRHSTDRPRERSCATGYQGTARRATTDGGSGHKPAKSNTLASATSKSCKGLTARRTAPRSTGMANVTQINISALRKPKRRSKLDSTLDGAGETNPKQFAILSTRWRVERRGRNKENDAPTAAEIEGRLFNPALGPPAPKPSVAKQPPLNQTLVSDKQLPTAAELTVPTTKAKRKSVHFGPNDDDPMPVTFTGSQVFAEPEEMDVAGNNVITSPEESWNMEIDSPESPRRTSAAPTSPTTPVRKVTFAEYQAAKTAPRSVRIKACFGSSSPLDIIFDRIPNDSNPRFQDQQWLQEFLAADVLRFRHQCLAELFLKRLEQLRPSRENHCSGSVRGKDDDTERLLSNVSERLKAGGNGLILSHNHYAVLVYPAKCDHWVSESLNSEEKESDAAVLRYVLFSPADDLSLMLEGEGTPPIAAELKTRDTRVCSMDQVLALGKSTFDRLVPPAQPSGMENPRFCLIFPQASAAEVFQVSMWIRACNPDAEVYTTHLKGSWQAFLSNLGPSSAAALIVHEAALRTLRRLPKLRLFLENPRDWVWRWPDKANLWNSLDAQPERLFPFGCVTLLTPSFVVSEPRLALETMRDHVRNIQKAIMVSHDFLSWAGDLAVEKSRTRDKIMLDRQLSDREREHKATLRGASMDDCQAISQLVNEMLVNLGPTLDQVPEESYTSNFLFAEECIDANDEQSLVNWFGWWSIANADKFRKFNVVGTRSSSKNLRRKRALLKIPEFAKNTVNDPDALLKKSREDNKKEAELSTARSRAADQPAVPAGSPSQSVQQTPAPNLAVFRSERLRSEDPKSFLDELNRIQSSSDRRVKQGVWRLYAFPIFWKDSDELYQHGRMNNHTDNLIRQWFEYTWPFDTRYRIYIGFFYTVEDSFDPKTSARSQRAPRRPWLVVYRINLDKEVGFKEPSSSSPTDIIILDSAACIESSSEYILEDCLPSAQQAVIEYVRVHEAEKKHVRVTMPPQKLAKVWIAGMPQSVSSLSPIDQCLRLVENLLDDPDLLPSSYDRLARKGFKPVLKHSPSCTAVTDADVAADGTTKLEPKIVFHPPVPDASFRGSSKCSNQLFEAARLARVKDRHVTHMDYEYRPTLEWYEEQRLEGRGWEHIWVGPYEKMYPPRQTTRTPTEQAASVP